MFYLWKTESRLHRKYNYTQMHARTHKTDTHTHPLTDVPKHPIGIWSHSLGEQIRRSSSWQTIRNHVCLLMVNPIHQWLHTHAELRLTSEIIFHFTPYLLNPVTGCPFLRN